MRNILLVFAALFFTLTVSGQPDGATKAKQTSSNTEAPTPASPNSQDPTTNTTKASSDETPQWYASLERPDWWLVIIGALTGGAIAYQAREMARTTKVIERQAVLMERQVKEAEGATKILEASVRAAEDNALAAKDSALASRLGVEAMIDKERARVRIKPETVNIENNPFGIDSISYTAFCYGTTPAFIREASYGFAISASTEPYQGLAIVPMFHEPVLLQDQVGTKQTALIFGTRVITEEINTQRQFVHFWGRVVYTDVFRKERETNFRYRWGATNIKNLNGTPFCTWTQCGSEADNRET